MSYRSSPRAKGLGKEEKNPLWAAHAPGHTAITTLEKYTRRTRTRGRPRRGYPIKKNRRHFAEKMKKYVKKRLSNFINMRRGTLTGRERRREFGDEGTSEISGEKD
ncbi:hypothetical protein EVAR_71558_1 [Eumeta japonica]|uniref:Uncharacterized protein n=1 Tax=Eumeta variegata TaxID=151549 RepID=A0A4C2AGT2_EUMVA|nr:hypothetical protein EVAR_71558_1 [Eumeta japonica]